MQLKISFLLLGLLFLCEVKAQQIAVKSFRKLPSDMSAMITAPRNDQNGYKCAIIKIVTTEKDFDFDTDALGSMGTVQKKGEIWLYVPYGAKRLTIRHAKLGILRDYLYPESIEKACVYEMVLTTGRVVTTIEDIIDGQWLVIRTAPSDAMVYLDDLYESSVNGIMQKFVASGKHTYRVEYPLYHTEAGVTEITNKEKKEILLRLKPAFGYLLVNSLPESDAKIWVDGEEIGTTPCWSGKLKSGEHRVLAVKPLFRSVEQKVTIQDGDTTRVDLNMPVNYAEITLKTEPEATLWINGQQKGIGSWSGRVATGMNIIEVHRPSHRPVKKVLELQVGEKDTAILEKPQPIYGILNISSVPAEADLYLNGVEYGKTPTMVRNLLIGSYELKLVKDGHAPYSCQIKIEEGKILTLENIELKTTKEIRIQSGPEGLEVWIDDKQQGKTPLTTEMTFGLHTIKVSSGEYDTEKHVNVTPEGEGEIMLKLNVPEKKPGNSYISGQAKGTSTYSPNWRDRGFFFIHLGFPVSFSSVEENMPEDNYEVSMGYAKRWGIYAKYKGSFSDSEAREAYLVGPVFRILRYFYYNLGVGYGSIADVGDIDNFFEKTSLYRGFEGETGLSMRIWRLGLQAQVSTINFQHYEWSVGIGFYFGSR